MARHHAGCAIIDARELGAAFLARGVTSDALQAKMPPITAEMAEHADTYKAIAGLGIDSTNNKPRTIPEGVRI